MRACLIVMMALAISACGVETASTAASVGAMKAKEAESANNAKDQIQDKINAAMMAGQQRLQDSEANR